jgi:pimeloyl-ACP methyl ester carboxylesterase
MSTLNGAATGSEMQPTGKSRGASPARIWTRVANLEVISKTPPVARAAPPLLFVHGAWHAAWCWNENFLDYFAANGFAAHALSLRGHGASEGGQNLRSTRIRDYVDDIAAVADRLPSPPILIGHSLGGFAIQKYLEDRSAPAAFLLASVPPTGVWRTLARATRDQPLDILKGNLTLSLWPVISNPDKARRLLFSPSVPVEKVCQYHRLLQDEAWLGYLDSLAFDLVNPRRVTTPMVVMGARDDAMIHPGEVAATAEAYNVRPILFEGMAHDMMLDTRWRDVAKEIVAQLDAAFPQSPPSGLPTHKAA